MPETAAPTIDPRVAHPCAFAHHASGGAWQHADHLWLIGRALMEIASGKIDRLMINVPPGHGKTQLISEAFPAWYLSLYPRRKIGLAAYEASFAAGRGRAAREYVRRNGDILGIQISPYISAAKEWEVERHGGGMVSVGIGGPLMGQRLDLVIVEDPIKNPQEALSPTIRDHHWDWWRAVVLTRLTPKGAVVLVQHRWHEDDLPARILREDEAERWKVLKLPAFAERGDPLGREEGAPLWPEMYPRSYLEDRRADVGPYWFSSLYQQNPQPEEGALVHRSHFRYFRDGGSEMVLMDGPGEVRRFPRGSCVWFQTCDTAQKTGQENDYTVLSTWLLTPENDLLLYDVFRERLVIPKQYGILQAQAQRYPELVLQAVEEKNAGIGLIQQGKLDGRPFRILKADTDKKTRFGPASVMYENGKIFHRVGAHWLTIAEDELLFFPNAEHDDIADTVAYAAILTREGLGPVRRRTGKSRVTYGSPSRRKRGRGKDKPPRSIWGA